MSNNPYLTDDNKPSEFLQYTLDYYGISIDEFKAMTDNEVEKMVKKFSDVLNDGQYKENRTIKRNAYSTENEYTFNPGEDLRGKPTKEKQSITPMTDKGSYSRYFDLDKWFDTTYPFLITPKASKREKNAGCENLKNNTKFTAGMYSQSGVCKTCGKTLNGINDHTQCCGEVEYREMESTNNTKNNHPTVKPLKLMSYLIDLGSREGDTVLDPFAGSGTTLVAAKMLNRQFIGCELDPEYVKIAEARLNNNELRKSVSSAFNSHKVKGRVQIRNPQPETKHEFFG